MNNYSLVVKPKNITVMKKFRYTLRLKSLNGLWHSSETFESFTALCAKYGAYIDEHPQIPFQICREAYFVQAEDSQTK